MTRPDPAGDAPVPDLQALLRAVEEYRCELFIAGEGLLGLSGPVEALPETLKIGLKRRKPELLRHLEQAYRDPQNHATPLGLTQQHMLFQSQLHRCDPYTISVAVDIEGPLDASLLRRSIHALHEHHPLLNAVPNLRSWPPALQMGRLQRIGDDPAPPAARCADGEPLVHWHLAGSGDFHHLRLEAHHLILDGTGRDLLFEQLGRAYRAAAANQAIELPLARPFAEFVARESRHIAEGRYRGAVVRAAGRLRGYLTPLWGATKGLAGAQLSFPLERELVADLHGLARRLNVSPLAVAIAAYALALGDAAGRGRIAVATPFSGRPRSGFEASLGCFAVVKLLPVDLAGRGLDAVAPDVQRAMFAEIEEEPFQPSDLLRECDMAFHEIEACFSMGNAAGAGLDLGAGLTVRARRPDRTAASRFKQSALLELAPGGEASLHWEYRTELFGEQEIRAVHSAWCRRIAEAAGRPAATPGSGVDLS